MPSTYVTKDDNVKQSVVNGMSSLPAYKKLLDSGAMEVITMDRFGAAYKDRNVHFISSENFSTRDEVVACAALESSKKAVPVAPRFKNFNDLTKAWLGEKVPRVILVYYPSQLSPSPKLMEDASRIPRELFANGVRQDGMVEVLTLTSMTGEDDLVDKIKAVGAIEGGVGGVCKIVIQGMVHAGDTDTGVHVAAHQEAVNKLAQVADTLWKVVWSTDESQAKLLQPEPSTMVEAVTQADKLPQGFVIDDTTYPCSARLRFEAASSKSKPKNASKRDSQDDDSEAEDKSGEGPAELAYLRGTLTFLVPGCKWVVQCGEDLFDLLHQRFNQEFRGMVHGDAAAVMKKKKFLDRVALEAAIKDLVSQVVNQPTLDTIREANKKYDLELECRSLEARSSVVSELTKVQHIRTALELNLTKRAEFKDCYLKLCAKASNMAGAEAMPTRKVKGLNTFVNRLVIKSEGGEMVDAIDTVEEKLDPVTRGTSLVGQKRGPEASADSPLPHRPRHETPTSTHLTEAHKAILRKEFQLVGTDKHAFHNFHLDYKAIPEQVIYRNVPCCECLVKTNCSPDQAVANHGERGTLFSCPNIKTEGKNKDDIKKERRANEKFSVHQHVKRHFRV